MANYVIDASAWVEYFMGSQAGQKVKDIVENEQNEITTNILTLAELSGFYARRNLDFALAKKIILSLSLIYSIDLDFVEEVGKLYAEMRKTKPKISLADIFVLLSAKKIKASLVTGDSDFKDIHHVILIK
ncbi:MAG TPA: PIN domain-containing protein [Patescibacteria group bacterium]|nr:PIN domain-containing protein [Patescibacteria group bacterium]